MEKGCSGSADGCESDDLSIAKFKVFGPDMLSRMEQRRYGAGFRIAADEIGSFVQIAPEAREREIFGRIISFMLAGGDVLNLECDNGLVIAMQVTVFTLVAGALIYKLASGRVHQDAAWRASQRRALA